MKDNQLDKLFRPALLKYAIGDSADYLAKDLRLFIIRNKLLMVCFGLHIAYFSISNSGISINGLNVIIWTFAFSVICIVFPINLWTDIKNLKTKGTHLFKHAESPKYCNEATETLVGIFYICIQE